MTRTLWAASLVIAVWTLAPHVAWARQEPDAAGLARRAEQALAKQDYPAATAMATEALAHFEAASNLRGQGRMHIVLGSVADLSGDFGAAAARFKRALEAFEAADDPRGRAVARLHLSKLPNPALDRPQVLAAALADARAAGDRVLEGNVLHSLGDGAFAAGAYAQALEWLEAAAALFDAAAAHNALGTVHNSLGRLYRLHGRIDVALQHQLKALALHEKNPSSFEYLQSLNAVAVTYQANGDSRNAFKYYERAMAIAEKTGSPRIQDFIRANAVDTMIAEGDLAKAAETLAAVIARGFDVYTTLRAAELAGVYMALGRTDEALRAVQQAVEVCGAPDGINCVRARARRAAVHLGLGRRDDALAEITEVLGIIESVRARLVPSDFFKQRFTEQAHAIYSQAISLHMAAGRTAEAIATAELARGRAFADLLASRDIRVQDRPPAPRSPLVFRGESQATGEAGRPPGDLLSNVTLPAASATELVETARRLRSTLLAYWVGEDALFIWVVDAGGKMRGVEVPVRRSRLAALVRATVPPTAASESNTAKALAPVTRGAQPLRMDVPRASAWRELYDLVVRPVRDALPAARGALLTIVPHGPLTTLAFAALLDDRGRYLIEDYTLHYAPAGAVFQFTAPRRNSSARAGRLLLVADPMLSPRSKLDQPLPPLPGARLEAERIAQLVAGTRLTRLEGLKGTEAAVKAAADGKAVLHFATHAIVRDDDPFASFLALGADPDGSTDGLLTAKEIYGLRVDADLVVLSACRAASGHVAGDGVAAFARGFIYAGVPTVVASLWDVADEPTNRLLPRFYRTWLAGASKARALRDAQLALLGDLRAGRIAIESPIGMVTLPEHPMFWAGFVAIGEPD